MESLALPADLLREVREAVGPQIASRSISTTGQPRRGGPLLPRGSALGSIRGRADPLRKSDAKAQLGFDDQRAVAVGEELSSKWAFAPYIDAG